MVKNIIITGGLGYIGTELCKLYSGVSWHHQIIVIDNRFISERVNQIRNWNMEFIQGDILDKNLINKASMSYKVIEENSVSTVYLNGEIDMDVTDKAKEVIMPLLDAKKEVHINLKDVQYMDSSGISVLIESHQKAEELGTKVTSKEISKSVLKVIMMAKLEQVLNLD